MNISIDLQKLPRRYCLVIILLVLVGSPQVGSGANPSPAAVELSAKRAIRLSFASRAGERYQLYRSRDGAVWETFGEIRAGTGGEIALTHVTEDDIHSLFGAETLEGEPVEVIKSIADFKSYETWKIVRALLGPDPALDDAHGGRRGLLAATAPQSKRTMYFPLPFSILEFSLAPVRPNGSPGKLATPEWKWIIIHTL